MRERSIARSTSWGSTLRPPVLMTSSARPSTVSAPSSAICARSEVVKLRMMASLSWTVPLVWLVWLVWLNGLVSMPPSAVR